MEKRTLLAIVLSLAVFLLWSYIFPPPPVEPPAATAPGTAISPNNYSDNISNDMRSQQPVQPAIDHKQKIAHKTIEVETPLYKAVFLNEGPSIKSFLFKQFRETISADSPFVEFLAPGSGLGGGLISAGFAPVATDPLPLLETDSLGIKLRSGGSSEKLVFRGVDPRTNATIVYTYTFYADRYGIDLTIDVINPMSTSVTGSFYSSIRMTKPEGSSGYYSYKGLITYNGKKMEEQELKKPGDIKNADGNVLWAAYKDDYFIMAVAPKTPSAFQGKLTVDGIYNGILTEQPVSIHPDSRYSSDYTICISPNKISKLSAEGRQFEKAIDYGWFDIIARPLLYTLLFFEKYVGNYGIAIILLTVLIKIIFWPLSYKSYKSMGEMKKLQPRLMKLREKYKDNKQLMNQEMMNLYRTYKINPMSGCFPMLIQLPVFFALFRVLGSAIELRHAPFMLWINDLSAPDRLFSFSFSIPLMSPPYGIPVLTLLMGASMWFQQKITPSPGDPTQARIMMLLPIIFTFMFINFPSGLVLYWFVNNILSMAQQYYVTKKSN